MAEETVQTVERACTALRMFSRDRPELRVSELARSLGLSRTIVIRILNTLERVGFVERTAGDARYRIGLAAFEVGGLYLATNQLVAVAGEVLDDLVEKTGHIAYLGSLDGAEAVILSLREGRSPVRFLNYPLDPDVYARLGPIVQEAAQTVTRRVETYHAYGQCAIL